MDPFTTLSLAASVIQIADVGVRLLNTARELYKTGTAASRDETLEQAHDFRRLADVLGSTLEGVKGESSTLDQIDRDLVSLCNKISTVAENLIEVFRPLGQSSAKGHAWDALLQAASHLWRSKKALKIMESLERHRNDLVLRIMVSVLIKYSPNDKGKGKDVKDPLPRVLNDPRYLSMEQTAKDVGLGAVQKGVLELLWSPFIYGRRPDVSESYQTTFHWAHKSGAATVSYPEQGRLASWLEEGGGCFWVNGKAGSGKSTFTKYLVGRDETASLLTKWAGDNPLLCPSFFFWSSGSTLQRSQEGLLRSILHEYLQRLPELIPIVFPIRTRQVSRGMVVTSEFSLEELKHAFQRFIQQTIVPFSVCFFIDGIDEYGGEHT
ncbi:hypothetical protein DL765_006489 [Monosporascus sp. GIB2]|nr:hypothetical protein DL765_006489 [Monosporascus sp. GIB2]